MSLAEIPDWLSAAIIGAVFATIAFFTKELIERRKINIAILAENISNLKSLLRLLKTQHRVFSIQCKRRDEIISHLTVQFPEDVQKYNGFEEKLTNLYDKMDPIDRENHLVVRGYTKGSLFPLNKKIQKLTRKINVNLLNAHSVEKENLKIYLENLDLHLNLWLAKYDEWIPDNPKHSLVYLADEKEHGIGFPTGIEDEIGKIISKQ